MKISCLGCKKLFASKDIILYQRERYAGVYGGDKDLITIYKCKKCFDASSEEAE